MGINSNRFKSLKNDWLWVFVGVICLVVIEFSINIGNLRFQWYDYLLKIAEIGVPAVLVFLLAVLTLRSRFTKLYDINVKKIVISLFCFKIIIFSVGVILVLVQSYSIIN